MLFVFICVFWCPTRFPCQIIFVPFTSKLLTQALVWDRHKNMEGFNWLMGSQAFPHGNWNSNGNTYINKRKYTPSTFVSTQIKDHILSQKYALNTVYVFLWINKKGLKIPKG